MNGRFLLDTNIVIASLSADPDVIGNIEDSDEYFISATILGEKHSLTIKRVGLVGSETVAVSGVVPKFAERIRKSAKSTIPLPLKSPSATWCQPFLQPCCILGIIVLYSRSFAPFAGP